MNSHWRIVDLISDNGPIKAVLRMKDDKVFSIGDRTTDGIINSFSVSDGRIVCKCGKVRINGYDGVSKASLVYLDHLVSL